MALQLNPKFAKAYNRMSKCQIALGNLVEATISLQKSIEIEPTNAVNKKDQKYLADLKITETLIHNAIRDEAYEKAVTNLNSILKDCTFSIRHLCLKIECLCNSFQFSEANTFSAALMKREHAICNNPMILFWRGRVLIYNGNEVLGKKHLVQAMNFDPDLKQCQAVIKSIKKAQGMKEEAAAVFKEAKYAEAIELFNECLEVDTLNAQFNATILLNISICQDKLGKKDEALRSLNKSIKYHPKYAKALVKRGETHVALENFNDAIRDFSEASEYDSNGFNVQAKLKDAQAKAKKAKKKDYFKILGVDKSTPDAVIRKAYKKLALKWHPDKNSSGTEEEQAKAKKMF